MAHIARRVYAFNYKGTETRIIRVPFILVRAFILIRPSYPIDYVFDLSELD